MVQESTSASSMRLPKGSQKARRRQLDGSVTMVTPRERSVST